MRLPRRRLMLAAVLALPLAAVLLLAVEAVIAARRDYFRTADFDIRFTTEGCRPPLRMVMLGDSTVEGVGATSERASLPGQVALKVADATGRAVAVEGFGASGAITADVVREQLPRVDDVGVDVIVIEVGSNDVTHRTRLRTLERQTRLMLERAGELAPIVVLGSSGRLNSPNFLPPLRQLVMARATAVRARQARVARRAGVPFMNVARDVSPTYNRTPGATSSDDFHPSDIGYEIWARPLASRVVDALATSASTPDRCRLPAE